MPELDSFERSLQAALRDLAERGVVPVDVDVFTARVAQGTESRPLAWMSVRRLTWLLLAVALLTVLLASVILVGAQLTDDGADDRTVLIRAFEPRDASAVALSPDGELLAAAVGTDVVVLEVDTGGARRTLASGAETGDRVWDIAFSPDAALVAAVTGSCGIPGARVHVWDVDSGELVLERLDDFGHMVTSVAFSPDGTSLAVGTVCAFAGAPDSAYVKTWDVSSGAQLLDIALDAGNSFGDVTFSPDGSLVADYSQSRPGTIISLWDTATGRLRLELHETSGEGWSKLAFRPDGTRLASTDPEVRVWDVASGDQLPRPEGPASEVQDIVFGPDGLTVIGCRGDEVRSWDAQTGALLTEVTVDRTAVGALSGETDLTQCRLAVEGDDTLLVTFGWGHDLRLWRVAGPP